MQHIDLANNCHKFGKINAITKKDKSGYYDELECKKCGIRGKRYGLNNFIITIKQYEDSKFRFCTGELLIKDEYVGKFLEVLRCEATWAKEQGFIPGTYHIVVTPPTGFINGDKGVWVMGNTEPFKLIFGEFSLIKMKRTKFNK